MKLLLQILAVVVLVRSGMMLMMSPLALASPGATNNLRSVLRLILLLAQPVAIGIAFYYLDWGLLWMTPKTLLILTCVAGSLGAVIYGFLLFNILRGVSNTGYTIKPNAVYYSGSKTKQADPSTFEVLPKHDDYARDRQHVYRMGKVLAGADPATFRLIPESGAYSRDQNKVYYEHRLVDGADAATFEQIRRNGKRTIYWRDENHIYVNGKMLPSSDAATFQLLGAQSSFARDKNHVYHYETLIDGADVESFELLSEHIARDAQRIYREDQAVLPMANAATFRLIGGDRFGADNHRVYFIPYYFKYPGFSLDQIDPKTFAVLGSGYAKDASTVYYGPDNEVTPVIDADPKTFVLLERSAKNDAKDRRREYLRGKAA